MSLSPNQIIAGICPELSGSPSLSVFIEMATEVTDKGFLGNLYNRAVALRACHEFTLFNGANGNSVMGLGQVSSVSEGGLSISFATNATNHASGLERTKYGIELLALIKSRPTMGVNRAGLP